MTASPQQRVTANTVRGYNPSYVAQTCTCGCDRAAHLNMTRACTCGCGEFALAAVQANVPPKRNYCFGTLPAPPAAPAPAAPEVPPA